MFPRSYPYSGSKSIFRMDPDCAICHAPANMACECEAKGLDVAVKQAEDRMMRSIYNEIRYAVLAFPPCLEAGLTVNS